MKKVFTTGDVAKICKVAARTVQTWFDSRRLRGYRIPGSADRRIRREWLILFLIENGMPLNGLDENTPSKILIVTKNQQILDALKHAFPDSSSVEIMCEVNGFNAGMTASSFNPNLIIVDFDIGEIQGSKISDNFKKKFNRSKTVVVELYKEGSTLPSHHSAYRETFRRPFSLEHLVARLKSILDH